MNIGHIDTDKRVFLIAEIGNNHEGDFTLAQEMIGRAAEVGVDAVKFQTFVPEHYVSSADAVRFDRLQKFQLTHDQFGSLSRQAHELGIIFFSTPFDLESAYFLNQIQPLFKISSGDNTFMPLIDAVAGFGKPTLISTGLADLVLLDRIHDFWQQKADLTDLAFLHCVSSYPTPLNQANLGAIWELRTRYPGMVIGYSDHTLGVEAAKLAVAAGARIVEKHFTLNKHHSDFRDHQLSADPLEMRQIVESIRELEVTLGTGAKVPQPCEGPLRMAVRRSIAAASDLPAGTILTGKDLTWVRPGTGIPVGQENQVIGRTTRSPLRQGELVIPELLIE